MCCFTVYGKSIANDSRVVPRSLRSSGSVLPASAAGGAGNGDPGISNFLVPLAWYLRYFLPETERAVFFHPRAASARDHSEHLLTSACACDCGIYWRPERAVLSVDVSVTGVRSRHTPVFCVCACRCRLPCVSVCVYIVTVGLRPLSSVVMILTVSFVIEQYVQSRVLIRGAESGWFQGQ